MECLSAACLCVPARRQVPTCLPARQAAQAGGKALPPSLSRGARKIKKNQGGDCSPHSMALRAKCANEELDFIVNYDIKYRMGKENDTGCE
ncbi:MAG: hypothetical protein AB1742_13960 [bacterium]